MLLFKEATGVVQFLRYGFMSAVALAVDIGLLLLLTEILSIHYVVAASVAFLAGAGVVYVGSIYWVFPKRTLKDVRKEVTIFILVGVAGLALTDAILYIAVEWSEQTVLVGKLWATVLVFFFNFTVRKFLLFT